MPIYEEHSVIFRLSDVQGTPLDDLIYEYWPVEEGWEFYGHSNFNSYYIGNTKVVEIKYRRAL